MNSRGPNAYSSHACSTSSDSLNPDNAAARKFARQQGGKMPQLLATGEGFATLQSTALGTTINVPLGWVVIEMLSGMMFYPPDESGSYVMVAPVDDISYSKFVSQAEENFRADLPAGNETSPVVVSALPLNGTLVTLEDVGFPSGRHKSIWKALFPHPQFDSYMMTITFTCPIEERDSFRELMNAMLSDLRLDFSSLRPQSAF